MLQDYQISKRQIFFTLTIIIIVTLRKNVYNSSLHCSVQYTFVIVSCPQGIGIIADKMSRETHIWFPPKFRPQILDARYCHMGNYTAQSFTRPARVLIHDAAGVEI